MADKEDKGNRIPTVDKISVRRRVERVKDAVNPRGEGNVFPGVWVTELRVTETPSGKTIVEEFSEPIQGVDFTPDIVSEFVEPRVPIEGEEIEYRLNVIAARPEAARAKARAFVRIKNPFEPDIINVETRGVDGRATEEFTDGPRKVYKVSAKVKKR